MIPFWYIMVGLLVGGCAGAIVLTRSLLTESFFERSLKLALGQPELGAKLTQYFARRAEYRLTLRLLAAGLLLLLIWLGCRLSVESGWAWGMDVSGGLRWAVAVLGGFWLVADILTPALPSAAARALLSVSLPVVNAARLLLFPFLLWPLGRWRARFLTGSADEGSLEEDVSRFVQEKIEDAGAGHDALRGRNQHNMIFGILDLDKTLVREVMTPRVEVRAVEDSATATDVRKIIVASGHSRLPVYRETIDHVVGIIHAKDLLREAPPDGPQGTLTPLLRNPVLIPETKNVAALLAEFQQNRTHFAVVLDEYGGTAGIITLEDILEEIIGDIHDEHDRQKGEPDIRVLPDGSLIAAGRVPVAELARRIALELPETTDYDTVAGLILSFLGRIPAKGETVETPQALFQILDADARRVLRVKITARQPAEPGSTP